MNISNLKEQDNQMKQEGANNGSNSLKPNLTTSSWSRLKDPRIVRVSRAFGGKDRHSKVCTVRGLRDRRVRLSVPTAIQLYDLQDRLGLNQPSKAVDWLLDAAKSEIDELPPLHIPPGTFGQNLQAILNVSSQEVAKTSEEHDDQEDSRNPNSCNFFNRNPNSSNLPGLLNSVVVPNNSLLKWDPSNLSLSQFGSYGSVTTHQHEDNALLYPPPPPQTQLYFPSQDHNNSSDQFDPKQLNFKMVSSSSSSSFTPPLYNTINQGMRPFHLRMNPKFFSSEDDGDDEHGLNK